MGVVVGDRARFLRLKGDYEGSLRYQRALLRFLPKDAGARLGLAKSLLCCGRLSEALEAFEEAHALGGPVANSGDCVVSLGALLLWVRRIEEGLHLLRGYPSQMDEAERKDFAPEAFLLDVQAWCFLAPDESALRAGFHALGDSENKRRFAHLCMLTHHFFDAARFYREAVLESPALALAATGFDLGSTVRGDMAYCMVLGGLGLGASAMADMSLCVEGAEQLRAEIRAWAVALVRDESATEEKTRHICRRFNRVRWLLDGMDGAARSAWERALAELNTCLQLSPS